MLLVAVLLAGCQHGPARRHAATGTRVVYRVVDTAAGAPRVTTQVVESLPPYVGRTATFDGAPPGGAPLGGAAWDAGHVYLVRPDGSAATVTDVAPRPSGVDAHLGVALATAERHQLVRRVGSAQVLGITCTQWLSKEPLDAEPFAPAAGADRTVSCVDAEGRLLKDVWTLRGSVVRTRTAVALGASGDLSAAGLLHGATPTPADPLQSRQLVRAEPAERLASAFGIGLPAAPAGFVVDRSSAFVTLDAQGRHRTEGIVLTYRAGTRLVVLRLEQGLSGVVLPAPTAGVPLALARASARLSPQLVGLVVSWSPRPGRLATLSSDLDETALLAWARALQLAPGP